MDSLVSAHVQAIPSSLIQTTDLYIHSMSDLCPFLSVNPLNSPFSATVTIISRESCFQDSSTPSVLVTCGMGEGRREGGREGGKGEGGRGERREEEREGQTEDGRGKGGKTKKEGWEKRKRRQRRERQRETQ